ncbi:MAG: DUF1905 domain-containing protein [Cyclobacteriaceae bacterium]|nr:DUF1905 domain-containing protein [Cyclobacteriaceae bacterium]
MPSSVKFKTRIKPLEHLKMSYIEVSKAIVEKLGGNFKLRLICTVNKTVSWQCGLVALKQGSAYISLNKKILKELNAEVGTEINVTLVKDESKYGMEMSAELKSLLKQDKEGSRRFHMLPMGKQRYIIYYVSQVKVSQLRIDRAIRLIENLKKTLEGKESFREIVGKKN